MKKLLLLLIVAFSITANAQDDKTVTLVVSGQGKTQDEAKQVALRSAIEQAFGTFISSKTEILNDNLVKDEIVSVSNGNIQKFEIISEVQIPNSGYATSLKATVSVTKLTSFVESKGVVVEFKGSLFAFNVNQQILNEKNEIKAIVELCKVAKALSDMSFNYTIKASDPISVDAGNNNWKIPLQVSVKANKNLFLLTKYIYLTIKGLSLNRDEALNYISLGKLTYPFSFAADNDNYCHVILRSDESEKKILELIYYFNHSIQNFKITNGPSTFSIIDNPSKLTNLYDYGFRVLIKQLNNGNEYGAYCPSSVFYDNYANQWRAGRDKKPSKSDCNNCVFFPGNDPILDYTKYKYEKRDFSTIFNVPGIVTHWGPSLVYFINQFSFVNSLKKDVVNNNTGIVISFIGINYVDDLVIFYLDDKRTLNEINQIKEYKVLPIVN